MKKYILPAVIIAVFIISAACFFIFPALNFLFFFLSIASFFLFILFALVRIGRKQAAKSAALLDKMINDRTLLNKTPSYESDTDNENA